jgi:hypothetical protein
MLIGALPSDDEDRSKFRLTSPTAYLEAKLLKQLHTNVQMARREMYVINMGVPTPGCKATARNLLDKHYHEFIALGGKRRLREFTKIDHASTSSTNLWRASPEASDWVLQADRKMSVFRAPLNARSSRQKRQITALTMANFPSTNVTELRKD